MDPARLLGLRCRAAGRGLGALLRRLPPRGPPSCPAGAAGPIAGARCHRQRPCGLVVTMSGLGRILNSCCVRRLRPRRVKQRTGAPAAAPPDDRSLRCASRQPAAQTVTEGRQEAAARIGARQYTMPLKRLQEMHAAGPTALLARSRACMSYRMASRCRRAAASSWLCAGALRRRDGARQFGCAVLELWGRRGSQARPEGLCRILSAPRGPPGPACHAVRSRSDILLRENGRR
jgi:hypothetical protein